MIDNHFLNDIIDTLNIFRVKIWIIRFTLTFKLIKRVMEYKLDFMHLFHGYLNRKVGGGIAMVKKVFITIFSLLVFWSCGNDDLKHNAVNIRLSNVSGFDYENIVVIASGDEVDYGDLMAGETSDYKVFEKAYQYAYVELEIEGNTYTIQPIDYVGETPLENGAYTYQIDANDSQEQHGKLSLTFVED